MKLLIFRKDKKDHVKKEAAKLLREITSCIKERNFYRAALLYQILARHFYTINETDKAVQYSLESAKYSLMTKRYFSVGWAYKNAAFFSKEGKNYDKAVQYALEASKYFSKTKSCYGEQWSYNIAAEAYRAKKDIPSAIKYYKKSYEIEPDDHIERKIELLTEHMPQPNIAQTVTPENAQEGEDVKFQMTIKNNTRTLINDISVLDEKDQALSRIEQMRPGDMKVLIYDIEAKGFGQMRAPYTKVCWKIADQSYHKNIESPFIKINPNIQMNAYIKTRPEPEKQSHIAFVVRNNSTTEIKTVRLYADFPHDIKIKSVGRREIEQIPSGEEATFVFKILPLSKPNVQIKWRIEFSDHADNVYYQESEAVLTEVLELPPDYRIKTEPRGTMDEEGLQKLRKLNEEKKQIHDFLSKKPITELDYVYLIRSMFFVQRGYTLGDVSVNSVCEHVLRECECMSLVRFYNFKNESLLLFSGESADKRSFLLTVAVKKQDDIVHIAFKLYSDKKEGLEDFLTKISEIIKYTIIVMSFAKEIERVEIKKIINIIDSIVQRSKIGENDANKFIKNSIIQREEK